MLVIRSLYVSIGEVDTGMTAFVSRVFAKQSLHVSFSKTPQALSLIRPFSIGKHHGNGVGKS